MQHLNDLISARLGAQGFTGSTNEPLLQWYKFNGATSNDLDTARKQFLTLQGFNDHTTDARFLWLRSMGLQGQHMDMWKDYWTAFPSVPLP
ncbi:MAG: hypothetical protein ACR2OR_08925 [Hyphomicrobiales bacterium]